MMNKIHQPQPKKVFKISRTMWKKQTKIGAAACAQNGSRHLRTFKNTTSTINERCHKNGRIANQFHNQYKIKAHDEFVRNISEANNYRDI